MNSRHDAEVGLIRDMVLQAKDAVEMRLGDTYPLRKFLFELDEFEMREFLWLYRKSLQECSCVAGLADSDCPQHGMHSAQGAVFYSEAKYEHLLHQFQALREREQSIRAERDTLLQSNSK